MGITPPQDFYRLDTAETLRQLRSNQEGLTTAEAAQRLTNYGTNTLETKRKESPVQTYIRQFKDWMILLLIISGVISFFLEDPRTAIVLLALVLFNTTIGFLQEFKAERIMESLDKLVVAEASIMRDGNLISVASSQVVPGDIVYIEAGMAIPADLRLLEEEELSTNDFALTGESNPTRKFTRAILDFAPLGSRSNLAFMGTTVATGSGVGVVAHTGMQTELGRIAHLSQDVQSEASPLQKEMNNIARRVSQGTVALCAILLPIATVAGLEVKDAFLFAIGIAASIIPQGLPAEINTALAQAASKLARAKALVKKLSSVEGLGATNVILTDKTGTLTKNQMTAETFSISKETYHVTGRGYEPKGTILDATGKSLTATQLTHFELFFSSLVFASNARVSKPDTAHTLWYTVGDPTEGALITLAAKAGYKSEKLNANHPELKEFAFDSSRKRMSSIRKFGADNKLHVFVKGAPENVLEQTTHIWDNGSVRRMTPKERQRILSENKQRASQAMRNLGVAYRVLPDKAKLATCTIENTEQQLVWLGMVSLIDPLREQVPNAMEAARKAHIRVSIITGDYAVTAKAIAERAKLTENPSDIIVVSGEELQHLSNAQVYHLAQRGGVIFSRVAPEDKLRIVSLVQKHGKVVAVTGDGINDAPALKRADIGVAMGLSGTDVAKQSAEIILLDDSFNTLIHTVEEGRTIFQNIRKGTLACFTSNAAELVVMLISLTAATFFDTPLALSVMLILAIDLVAELFPIAALGRDKADGDLMHQPPRNMKHHILDKSAVIDLAWCGLLIGSFAFINYLLFFGRYDIPANHVPVDSTLHMKAMALTYLTIVLCQLANILQRRTSAGLFSRYQLHNRQLWLAMGFSLFCVVTIIYNPWIAPYFKAAPLGVVDWVFALGAAGLFIAIREFQRHDKKHRRKAVLHLHRHQRFASRR